MVQIMRPNFGPLKTVSQLTFAGRCWPFPVFHVDYLIPAHIHARVSKPGPPGRGEAVQCPAMRSWGGGRGQNNCLARAGQAPSLGTNRVSPNRPPFLPQPAPGSALSASLELLSQDLQGFSPEPGEPVFPWPLNELSGPPWGRSTQQVRQGQTGWQWG